MDADPAAIPDDQVESVSSLVLADNGDAECHPNTVKTCDQLLDGGLRVVVLRGRSVAVGGGQRLSRVRIILVPPGVRDDDDDNNSTVDYERGGHHARPRDAKFRVTSTHGYQTALPDGVKERNRLCASLLARRGPPLIRCDGGLREHLVEARRLLPPPPPLCPADDVKVEQKHLKVAADRNIMDMFAEMRKTTRDVIPTSANDDAGDDDDTDDHCHQPQEHKSPTSRKSRRPLDNPLERAFEVQRKRVCCKKREPQTTTTKKPSARVTSRVTTGRKARARREKSSSDIEVIEDVVTFGGDDDDEDDDDDGNDNDADDDNRVNNDGHDEDPSPSATSRRVHASAILEESSSINDRLTEQPTSSRRAKIKRPLPPEQTELDNLSDDSMPPSSSHNNFQQEISDQSDLTGRTAHPVGRKSSRKPMKKTTKKKKAAIRVAKKPLTRNAPKRTATTVKRTKKARAKNVTAGQRSITSFVARKREGDD